MDHLDVKLEARYDHSTARVFATHATASDGTGPREKDQLVIALGIVVHF